MTMALERAFRSIICNCFFVHSKFNRRKSSLVFERLPVISFALERVMRKADTSKKVARTLAKDNCRSKILAKIESHLENGDVTREEIQPLLSEQFITKELPVDVQPLYLNDKWIIVRDTNGLATVTDGQKTGIVPTWPSPDASWTCPFCGSFGPWNGVICLTCGQKSDPND